MLYHSIIAIAPKIVFFWYFLVCDEKLFDILYLCIYFFQKIAEPVLERLQLLDHGARTEMPDSSLNRLFYALSIV